jgi:transposase
VVGTVYALLTYILGFVALEVSRAGTTPQTSDEFVRCMWAAFAMLCGASPVPASSGKTVRHRLNRGGNRQANTA